VMSAEVFTNFSKYPNIDTQRRFYLPLIERLESQPGVVAAAVTNAVPLRATQPGSVPFQIEGRADDTPESIRNRLRLYHEQTEPLIEHYRARGNLVGVPANRPIEQVFEEIQRALEQVAVRR